MVSRAHTVISVHTSYIIPSQLSSRADRCLHPAKLVYLCKVIGYLFCKPSNPLLPPALQRCSAEKLKSWHNVILCHAYIP